MQQGVLITNGGPHSAAAWAEATASHIVEVADHVAGEKRTGAVKLQAAVVDILEGHHRVVQDGERKALAAPKGAARLSKPLADSLPDHIDVADAVAEIVAAAKGTPWEADFAKPETAEHIAAVLTSHLNTNLQIERLWHADRQGA